MQGWRCNRKDLQPGASGKMGEEGEGGFPDDLVGPPGQRWIYCSGTVQLVPPARSAKRGFILSEQKPRWPVDPTTCGTPMTP